MLGYRNYSHFMNPDNLYFLEPLNFVDSIAEYNGNKNDFQSCESNF